MNLKTWTTALVGILGAAIPGTALGWAADEATATTRAREDRPPYIVFVTGDEEYRSEESMPMLAAILKRDFGFKVTVLYAVNSQGEIDPYALDNIPHTEVLDDADLMVMFTRFRKLPPEQLAPILRYAESGKPVVGFRTATHAFRYDGGELAAKMNEAWPKDLFGQCWITHHGHFGDGLEYLTAVEPVPNPDEPILRGVKPFLAYSWLYHVEGGGDTLTGDCKPLAIGRTLKSSHAARHDRYPATNPVAWTKIRKTASGKEGRVFFTTLGHPFDFKDDSMRRLALQGILWALGQEERIPAEGVSVEFASPYEPNNSGFGPDKYQKGRRPEPIASRD